MQIEQGAPVDVFLSAATKQMDDPQAKGFLVEGTRRDFSLHNVKLCWWRRMARHFVTSFQDLLKPSVKHVALGEPAAVPAGQYAQQVLMKLGIAAQVNAKAVYAKDVRSRC